MIAVKIQQFGKLKTPPKLYCFYVKSVSDSLPLGLLKITPIPMPTKQFSNSKWLPTVLRFYYDHRDPRCLYDNGIPTTTVPRLLLDTISWSCLSTKFCFKAKKILLSKIRLLANTPLTCYAKYTKPNHQSQAIYMA